MIFKDHIYSGGLTAMVTIAVLALPLAGFAQTDSEKSKSEEESTEKPTEIVWRSYEDGLKFAQDRDKQVFIEFSTAWCGYCKKMDRETFTDKRVINYINENLVAVRVDADSRREFEIDGFKTTERNISKEVYGVRGYPTFWFLESDGSKIGSQSGYQPATGFLTLLEYVIDRKYDETRKDTRSANQ